MKAQMLVLSLLVLTLSAPAHAYIGQRELRLDAAGLKTMQLTCGAGELRVEGTHAEEIRVAAEIEIKGLNDEKAETFAQKNIDLWLRKDGSRAYLKSEVHGGSWRGGEAAVHLTVFVPARFYLDISDGSGSIDIQDVAKDVVIESDGSGSRRISNVRGNIVERE